MKTMTGASAWWAMWGAGGSQQVATGISTAYSYKEPGATVEEAAEVTEDTGSHWRISWLNWGNCEHDSIQFYGC